MAVFIIENKPPFNNLITTCNSVEQACQLASAYNKKIANSPNDTYTIKTLLGYKIENYTEYPVYEYTRYYREWILVDENGCIIYTTPEQRGEIKRPSDWPSAFQLRLRQQAQQRKAKPYNHRHGRKLQASQNIPRPHLKHTMQCATDVELKEVAPLRKKACPRKDDFWNWGWHKASKSWKDQSKRRHQWYRNQEYTT